MANGIDPSALSTILVEYQGQLSQMSMALLTGAAVLLFANRKKRDCLPLCTTVLGGLMAAFSGHLGLQFIEETANSFVKSDLVNPHIADVARWELYLIIAATVMLCIAALSTEKE